MNKLKRKKTLDRYKSPEHWDTFEKVSRWGMRINAMKYRNPDINMDAIVKRVRKKHGVGLNKPHLCNLINFIYIPGDDYVCMIEEAISYYERKMK